MSAQRRILHCDMDCFYAAVHIRDQPELAGQPVVVGGDPNGRGVVAAASYEARRYGIHSALPAARALRLCPEVVFIRPNFELYSREAKAIFAIYREITPLVEPMSLDEAYLDVSEHLGSFGSATAIAKEIRRRVKSERRLTVSVGVGPNKLVAKIASDHGKPDGLTVVPPSKVLPFLAPLPVERMYGIGPATARVLHEMEVRTVADLRRLSLDRLLSRFGSWGRTLYEYARGVDERKVHTTHARKSLSTEQTFAVDLEGLDAMDRVLAEQAVEVAEALERRALATCTITIKVRFDDFTTCTRSWTLSQPTASAEVISACARELLRRTEAGRRRVRLLGVGTAGLLPATLVQPPLFAVDELQSAGMYQAPSRDDP